MSPLLFCRYAQTSAAVLLAGTMALRLLAWGTGGGAMPRWNRLAFGSWCVLVAAGAWQLVLTAADMSGMPLAQAFSGEVLGGVLDGTRFGVVWEVRAGLLAGLFVVGCLIAVAGRGGKRPGLLMAGDAVGAMLMAALLASLVWTGHAQASEKGVWLLPVNVVHAVAAGAWPGGLLPLAFLLARTRRDPDMGFATMTITRRFSWLSVGAVGVLAFSGALNGYGLVGSFSALWLSGYGRLLMCKVAIFAGMVSLGATNRRLIRPEDGGDTADILRRLWRNVAWECVLAAGVLLATEALATSAPPG